MTDLYVYTHIHTYTKIIMDMTSPTGDVAMLVTAIAIFCSHTDKYRIYSLVGPRPIRSSNRMGMVPKMLCDTRTIWLCLSRKHERDDT